MSDSNLTPQPRPAQPKGPRVRSRTPGLIQAYQFRNDLHSQLAKVTKLTPTCLEEELAKTDTLARLFSAWEKAAQIVDNMREQYGLTKKIKARRRGARGHASLALASPALRPVQPIAPPAVAQAVAQEPSEPVQVPYTQAKPVS